MKVTVDGILGSARRINNQRQVEEDAGSSKKKKDIKTDSVTIGSRINSRLDSIETELRDIQNSLTKNQIVKDGIDQLQNDLSRGSAGQQAILTDVTFNKKQVLRDYVGEPFTGDTLTQKSDQINLDISGDVSRLKKLQVEVDNIMASNLAGAEKVESLMGNINTVVSGVDASNLENISRLSPDAVMKLIR